MRELHEIWNYLRLGEEKYLRLKLKEEGKSKEDIEKILKINHIIKLTFSDK